MRYSIFDKISTQYDVKIKSADLKKNIPSVLSKNKKVFYVNKKFSLESQVYSIFHTLAHSQLGTICSKSTSSEEKAAEILNYELLIPEAEIKNHINDTLFKLKDIFPYCTYETIARRLHLIKKYTITIWHNYELILRENPYGQPVNEKPHRWELECMRYSYRNQSSIGRGNENEKLRCLSYFIKEESKNKVILFTERM